MLFTLYINKLVSEYTYNIYLLTIIILIIFVLLTWSLCVSIIQ